MQFDVDPVLPCAQVGSGNDDVFVGEFEPRRLSIDGDATQAIRRLAEVQLQRTRVIFEQEINADDGWYRLRGVPRYRERELVVNFRDDPGAVGGQFTRHAGLSGQLCHHYGVDQQCNEAGERTLHDLTRG